MEEHTFTVPEYSKCRHIKREQTNISITTEILQAKMQKSQDAKILPLFEEKLLEYKYLKHCSLKTTEFLKCRWKEYLNNAGGKIRTPFKFPRVDDYHYSAYSVRYNPKESISNRVNNRYHLKSGPGVDAYGQLPIPNDMHLERGVALSKKTFKAVKK